MGPRWLHRGNRDDLASMFVYAARLQWGRGGYTAEISTPTSVRCTQAGLQWGRGGYTAEMEGRACCDRTRRSLQWGRGGYTAEIDNVIVEEREPRMLQWGRGGYTAEIRASEPTNSWIPSFNGAAVVTPRK